MKTVKKILNFTTSDENQIEKNLHKIREVTIIKFMATVIHKKDQQVVLQFRTENDLKDFEQNVEVSALIDQLCVK